MKAAESGLRRGAVPEVKREEIVNSLDHAEAYLEQSGDTSSRWALVEHERGVLAWKKGDTKAATEHMERARKTFEEKHGPDSFHASAVNLRLAELELLRGEYHQAIARFQVSVPVVGTYLGAHAPFPLRMKFRQVACLVSLARYDEAVGLARESLADLRETASEQDQSFLQRTGASLDLLRMKGLFADPPSGQMSWAATLKNDGKRERDSETPTP